MLLENFVGKGENAGNQHFLLFPQCFFNSLIGKKKNQISYFNFVVCKFFQFGPVQKIAVWYGVESLPKDILEHSQLGGFAEDEFDFA